MFTLNCKGRLLVVDKPLVMGIINVTPDSFYSGSRFQESDQILRQTEQMIEGGAAILDIGGQSTRPGSERISAEGELRRVIPIIEMIHERFPESLISIDTYHGLVAKEAVHAGASIINDISAGSMDPTMIPSVARLGVPYVLMHMQGRPDSMQKDPSYRNIMTELIDFFIGKVGVLKQAGIHDIIVDPGFGFGKTIAHNFSILRNLQLLQVLGLPVLAGLSRKSSVYKTLGITAAESLNGSTVMNTIALLNGAAILRVHDVKEAVEVARLVEIYLHPELPNRCS